MEREWRTISLNPNYEVSNYGEIRNKRTNRVRKLLYDISGYPIVRFKCNNGKCRTLKVHRLVAQAFIPNPLNKPCVNHKDFNRTNNHISNLEWVTVSENALWSSENISKARRGKGISNEIRKKISECLLSKSVRPYPPYIHKTLYGYRFDIRRNDKHLVQKNFKTLEEAESYKNNWIKENKEIFEFA